MSFAIVTCGDLTGSILTSLLPGSVAVALGWNAGARERWVWFELVMPCLGLHWQKETISVVEVGVSWHWNKCYLFIVMLLMKWHLTGSLGRCFLDLVLTYAALLLFCSECHSFRQLQGCMLLVACHFSFLPCHLNPSGGSFDIYSGSWISFGLSKKSVEQ